MLGYSRHVVGLIPIRENAAVDHRVQCLHTSLQHLRKAGHLADPNDRDTGICQSLGSPSGGHDLDATRGKRLGKRDNTVLIRDRDKRPPDRGFLPFVRFLSSCVRRRNGAQANGEAAVLQAEESAALPRGTPR